MQRQCSEAVASVIGSPEDGLIISGGGSVLPDFPEEGILSPVCTEALVLVLTSFPM